MTKGFVIDTPDLDLNDQDLAILQNAINTSASRSEGPNHLFDAADLTRLKASLNSTISCDSENVQLGAPSIITMKNAGLSGGGGGGGAYVAKAVHLNVDTVINSEALTIANQATYTISVLARFPAATFSNASADFFTLLDSGDLLSPLWNVTGDLYIKTDPGDVNEFISVSPDAVLSPDTWLWLGVAVDVGHAAGSRTAVAFVNDTNANLSPDNGGSDIGSATVVTFNGQTVRIRGSAAEAEIADLWVAPGVLLDFTDPSVRQKFFKNGKPVDLGANGELPTGTAPQFFFKADGVDPLSFLTNHGTGDDTFTVTAGTLTNATTSPSD